MTEKTRVLFLCTQNSARSQMAVGILRHLAGDRFEAYRAGIDPTAEIHPCAVEAIEEVGIDISEQYPKGLRTYIDRGARHPKGVGRSVGELHGPRSAVHRHRLPVAQPERRLPGPDHCGDAVLAGDEGGVGG
jgi:Low molecular weight phosphotyrosine protein phosphatase